MKCVALCLSTALLAQAVLADSSADDTAWLSRIMTASQGLSYSGTFVYQRGSQSETSRVVRIVDASGERERLEVLDGTPREVVRFNEEVRCYLPDQRLILVERSGTRRSFPAVVSGLVKGIGEHYAVRVGETERLAGLEVRVLQVEPRDAWRYGYRFWADLASGLLIKARTVDERGESVEQFAFTQLSYGETPEFASAISRLEANSSTWQVEHLDSYDDIGADSGWRVNPGVPGFARTVATRRRFRKGVSPVTHLVYSDGLAAVSLFIGPAASVGGKHWARRQGAANMYSRRIGDFKVLAVGEVPMATVRRFADSVEADRP